MPVSISDEDAFELLRAVTAAHDDNCQLWPAESAEYARSLYVRGRGAVPSIDSIIAEVGQARAEQMLPEILDERKFKNALRGYNSPCHYCGSAGERVYLDFALMRVSGSSISIGQTVASAALSTVTIPLLGVGALSLPGKSLRGAAFHLKLVVCKPCCKKEGNMFGFFMNERRASRHPLWSVLHEHGFTKFLPKDKMPDNFRYNIGQYL